MARSLVYGHLVSSGLRACFRVAYLLLASVALHLVMEIGRELAGSGEAQARASAPQPFVARDRVERPGERDAGYYQVISRRDVFNPPKPASPTAVPAKPRLSVLSARLLGTAPSSREDRSFAVVEETSTGAQRLVRMGEVLQGRKLVRVALDSIALDAGDGEEILEVPLPPRALRAALAGEREDDGTPRYTLSALRPIDPVRWAAGNNPELALADIAPEMENGALRGFRISAIVPHSAYDRAGFKNGDLVTALDGRSFASALRGLQALRKLRDRSAGVVRVLRRGETIEVDVAAAVAGVVSVKAPAVASVAPRKEQLLVTRRPHPHSPLARRCLPKGRGGDTAVVTASRAAKARALESEEPLRVSTASEWSETDAPSLTVAPNPTDPSDAPRISVHDMRLVHRGEAVLTE